MQPLTAETFFVDNSMCELITTCPWLAYASIIRRRRPSGGSPPLRFGGFEHRALAYRYKMQGFNKAWNESCMIRILDHLFRTNPLEVEGWRNFDSAVKVIRGYNARYPKEDFDIFINPTTGMPYVETPFAVDTHTIVRGRRIIYMGRIDVKVVFPDRCRYILDHKTTTMLGDDWWAEQEVSPQYRGYLWADRECTGDEATGYIVNAIGARQSINNAYFDDALNQVVPLEKKSKAIPLEFARQRFFTRVPTGQLDEWFTNMLGIVDEFLYCVDNNNFPRHRRHCVGKYGKCQFYPVCSLPTTSREDALLSGGYEENTWLPLYN